MHPHLRDIELFEKALPEFSRFKPQNVIGNPWHYFIPINSRKKNHFKSIDDHSSHMVSNLVNN